jgi:hypothetical protein
MVRFLLRRPTGVAEVKGAARRRSNGWGGWAGVEKGRYFSRRLASVAQASA